MASHGNDPLAGASWDRAGTVIVDSALVALGDPDTYLSWKASWSPYLSPDIGDATSVLDEKLVFFETVDDVDCPVEKGSMDGDVVAVRVEILSDVAELNGAWGVVGEVSLDRGRCLVVDPRTLPTRALQMLREPASSDIDLRTDAGYVIGCLLSVPAGRYLVEEFKSEDYGIEGVRLRHADPSLSNLTFLRGRPTL
jgi:hypothetical protein